MKKAPFVSALKASGFTPYLHLDNKSQFVKDVHGHEIYVQMPEYRHSNGVISVTNKVTNERILTSYFSDGEGLFIELGAAIQRAYIELLPR